METLREKIRENRLLAGLSAGIIILASLVGFLLLKPEEEATAMPVLPQVTQQVIEENLESSSAPSPKSDKIMVDVKGAVVSEGVYELEEGDRVRDAIDLAGGLAAEADKNSVNLAQKLEDEAVIYVAKMGEEVTPVTTSGTSTQADTASSKVDINKATAADLMTVSGIGEKRAQDIIAYREEHGKFSSLDELTNVSGIGTKTLEKLQAELTLD